ncbi:hypothetical protein [Kistimonas asteriae]|uniref:hypothetical protein n=1 Tax=Kistimonas asteriae TaxID=517724 RepID=UPI001BA49A52|nr:hypothetical protein [Kistimonas asteriae]
MGKIRNPVLSWLIMLVGLLGLTPVSAADCFSASPLAASGKAFEPTEARKLTSSEQRQIDTLFRKMAKQWEGETHGYFCMGTENTPRKKPDNYQLTATVKQDSSGNIRLEADLYSPQKKTSRRETLRLFSSRDFLRIDVNNASGDVALVSLDNQHLTFIQTFRVTHRQPIKRDKDDEGEGEVSILPVDDEVSILPAIEDEVSLLPEIEDEESDDKEEKIRFKRLSTVREIVRTITVSGAYLTIDYKVYTQGLLSSATTWRMKKAW